MVSYYERLRYLLDWYNYRIPTAANLVRKEVSDMGRKDNYSYRLSKRSKDYVVFCSGRAGMSESKFIDFLLCSLASQDPAFRAYENETSDSNDKLSR